MSKKRGINQKKESVYILPKLCFAIIRNLKFQEYTLHSFIYVKMSLQNTKQGQTLALPMAKGSSLR